MKKCTLSLFILLKKNLRYLGIGGLLLTGPQLLAQQLAFPTAQGFGRYATGGRGGKVYAVTNLNDAGSGSFREALSSYPGEPLTIIFRVGGTITLLSELQVKRSNLTIAGQTAPGSGICLKGHSFILNGARAVSQGGNHGNVIIRYLRSRPGSTLSTGVYGFDMENCHNVIIDHCSFSWANEECAAMYDTKRVTVQWSIMSEGLYNAGHAKGVRGYGGVWGGQYSSFHHNLIAHQNSRAIRFGGARAHDTVALVDYRNNVIYNSGGAGAAYGGEIEVPGGISQINLVNNYYKPGPAASSLNFVNPSYNAIGIGKWYIAGNYMHGNSGKTNDNWTGVSLGSIPAAQQASVKSTTPFNLSGNDIPVQTAQAAYTEVLQKAGANLPIRDAVDQRMVTQTTNGTASVVGATSGKAGIIDLPSEVGGWPTYNNGTAPTDTDGDGMPDAWETTNGTNPNTADNNADPDGDGYTNLEEYLNYLTGENTGSATGGQNLTIQENTTGFCSLNGTVDNDNAGYSGAGFANAANAIDSGITWKINVPANATYTIIWRQANGSTVNRNAKLFVNGTEVLANIDFPATGAWTTWTEVSISRSLTAGGNTLRLAATTANGLANIDYLKVNGSGLSAASCSVSAGITIQENTNGFCSLNGTIDNDNAGFTGAGFANAANAAGNGITWRVNMPSAGTYTLTWRQANGGGSNRPGRLLVNGTEVLANIDFPATTDWVTWTDVVINRSFNAGQNTIRLESTTANGLANIDYLAVSGDNPAGVSCTGALRTVTPAGHVEGRPETGNAKASAVYPNPAVGIFTLTAAGKFDYRILDNQGKQVEKGSGENRKAVGAAIAPGIYFIKIRRAGITETLKIMKQ